MKKIVLDANVFCSLFLKEEKSNISKKFLFEILSQNTLIIVPSLFEYEIRETLLRNSKQAYETGMEYFFRLQEIQIEIISPADKHWLKATEIVKSGNNKSGFPSLYDSIYQAIAIIEDAEFITLDKRHFLKTKIFGNISLL